MFTGASYAYIQPSTGNGWFTSGQNASILLAGIGFNNTGGPILFNHLAGIATDGQHLVVADRNNNRVLIWNALPSQHNATPDLVLGQTNFYSNNPGHGLAELNWPTQVSIGGGKLVVADTDNNRILIWNTFPTKNDQPADLEIAMPRNSSGPSVNWPWGVWTNGKKLIVSSTFGSSVFIWNTFPTSSNQSPSIILTDAGRIGTPRQITSDGNYLMVGDHNPRLTEPPGQYAGPGTFVWDTFPTSNNSAASYFLPGAQWTANGQDWDRGVILGNGTTVLLGSALYILPHFPTTNDTIPSLTLQAPPGVNNYPPNLNVAYLAGDGSDLAYGGGRLYMALYNQNKIVVFNGLPNSNSTAPSFVIGVSNAYNNTLASHYFMTNPMPVTDGNSLFVASDFDRKLYVYRNLPNQSGAYPDIVYNLSTTQVAPWAASIYNGTLAIGGFHGVYIWHKVPLDGQMPDIQLINRIGNVQINNIRGIAMDAKYFYIADAGAGKIYVWNGLPNNNTDPIMAINATDPERLSSDGNYLVVTETNPGQFGGQIAIYRISNLSSNAQPIAILHGNFNLPEDAIVSHGHLFVADTGFNRVLGWQNITSAIEGKPNDLTLGCQGNTTYCDLNPEIGRNTLFWPGALAFDGKHLWVGEYKFSGRLLRFDVATSPHNYTNEKYLMTFLACNTTTSNCSNPMNHMTYLAQSSNGKNYTLYPGFKPYSGSVPDLVDRNGTLYIYNPGQYVTFNLSTGTESSAKPVALSYSNGTRAIGFVDPSPILSSNGTIVLFYMPAILGQDPAQCPTGQTSCIKNIMSATEVKGSGGSAFVIDPGVRVSIQISSPETASDPAVFSTPKGYVLLVSQGQGTLAFSSPDLEGNYTPIQGLSDGLLVPQGTGGVPSGFYNPSDGMYSIYVTSEPNPNSPSVIKLATVSNLNSTISNSEFSTILSGCSIYSLGCSYTIESPGVFPK